MASTQTSKDIVQRGFDSLNDRDRDAFVELHAEDAVLHAFGERIRGIDEIVAIEFGYFEAFPDLTLAPREVIAEGEMVAVRWTATGTHEGEFDGIEPTGEEVEYPLAGIFRVENERVAEVWLVADRLELMRQLGVVGPFGEPSSRGVVETVASEDGTEIAVERTGSGPPLVLVHGNGDVRGFWDLAGARSAFAEHHTVYAVERRGRGESGDSTAYDLEREAEDVAAVVDAIDEPVSLLGHSGGALYSLEAALRTGDLRVLVLNEPPIAVGEHELDVEAAVSEMERLLDDGENEQALVLFLRDVGLLTPDELDAARSAPIWQDMVDAAHTLPRELRAIAEYEFDAARFGEMTAPTLVSSGGESPPFYEDATKAVHEALPNGRIVTFDGHAHEPMNTAPDRFVQEVLAFVRDPNDTDRDT